MKDYYEILGLPETASSEEIRKAYRKLAFQYHPDKNPGNKSAETKFKEISGAYYVLSDPRRKAEYDEMRKRGGSAPNDFADQQGFDFEELLRQFGGGQGRPRSARGQYSGFNDIFSEFFSGGTKGFRQGSGSGKTVYEFYSSRPAEPDLEDEGAPVRADIYVDLKISKEKAKNGGRVSFRIPGGKTFSVTIPPNTRGGQKLKLTRQGRLCPACRHEGDIILQVGLK